MGISRVDMDPPPAKMWEKMNISPAKWDEKILTEPEKKEMFHQMGSSMSKNHD